MFPLHRLIGVGICPQGDISTAVIRCRQFPFKLFCGIDLVTEPGFKIDAGGEIKVGVSGPGIAVGATVLTSLVRVDRLGERDVRGVIARNYASGSDRATFGLRVGSLDAVVPIYLGRVETAAPVANDPAPFMHAALLVNYFSRGCHDANQVLYIKTV